jgi:hypothetical protein
LEREANFFTPTNGGKRPVAPPHDVVADLLSLPHTDLPHLVGLVEAPYVRPDGTICTEPGYDPQTGLFYWKPRNLVVEPPPLHPTPAQVAQARQLLQETLADFPFICQASRANALAAIITTVIRAAIEGLIPLGIIDATQQGTGKGLLAGVPAIIATGRQPALMTAPSDTEEWRRQITSVLLEGPPIVLIDNLADRLDSHVLAAALTTPVWRDRKLRSNEMFELPQRAVWLANGNNVQIGGDIQRRCYWIRLDPRTNRPWQRTGFRHPNLHEWVRENRGALIAAVLTLARAWYAANQPAPTSPPILGSFEEWSRVIGGILAFAGVDGFLGNAEAFYGAADAESAEWESFLAGLEHWRGTDPFLASELVAELDGNQTLCDALPDELADIWAKRHHGGSTAMKFGHVFRRREGRRYGSEQYRLERGDLVQKTQQWLVAKGK